MLVVQQRENLVTRALYPGFGVVNAAVLVGCFLDAWYASGEDDPKYKFDSKTAGAAAIVYGLLCLGIGIIGLKVHL